MRNHPSIHAERTPMQRGFMFLVAIMFLSGQAIHGQEPLPLQNLRLEDSAGKSIALDAVKDAKAVVVVFLGTQCPINNAYLPRLAELHAAYASKGVHFIAVNSNQHDSSEAIRE